MSKIVVLAEKPSVGRDIGRVLNCNKKGNGFLEGEKYIVTWALGHLVTLADPEMYDEKYKSWNIADLPVIPNKLKLVVIKQSGKQFNSVKAQLTRKDVSEIIIATDAGREGELVARWIIEKSHVRKPIKRLWISSVTDKAIKDGFKSLKNGKLYENLYFSAIARAEADWIVGINATRALTCKYNAQLSCGRVQTPTLAIINKREDEIKNFKPKRFYSIKVITDKLELLWQDSQSKDIKSFNEDKIKSIIKDINNKECEVVNIEEKIKKSFAPRLYDLTELQRDCNKIFGFSPKETLGIMQKLYEHYKVLTYPRTDSRYITTDIVDTLKERVKACGIGPYSKFALNIAKKDIKGNSNFVDNKKVGDHHAIIPTEEKVCLTDFNDRERKVYDLVVKRFLAVLDNPFEYKQISLKCKIENNYFIAKGKQVISYGWKELYSKDITDNENDEIKEQIIDHLKKGDKLKVKSILKVEGQTKPPAPFNEATLLSAMENPSKYMEGESKELIKTIGETGGLGTVATRADIIEKLFATFLIEKKGKDIYLTSKGKQLLDLAPVDLKTPTLTAQWEQKLNAISKGKLNKDKFINEMIGYTKEVVKDIKNSKEKFTHDNMTRSKCPQCGKYMLEVNGKKGKMLVCQDRECGYRKGLSKVTNSRCPNCHKKLELRGEGEGRIFVCSCGYKEKLSTFNERKKKETSKITKREVNKYLKNQNDEDFGNTALAEALSKLKF